MEIRRISAGMPSPAVVRQGGIEPPAPIPWFTQGCLTPDAAYIGRFDRPSGFHGRAAALLFL